MEIVNFGHFTTDNLGSALVHVNEDGQDWYELRRALTSWSERGDFISAIYGAWALVDVAGVITNVEYDPSRMVPDDKTVLGIDADWREIKPGMIYRNGLVSDPPEPTLEERRAAMRPLTPREFRDALIDNDIMPDQVTAAINQMEDLKARAKALNAWEYPTEFTRSDPLVEQIGTIFGLTPEMIDKLWTEVS